MKRPVARRQKSKKKMKNSAKRETARERWQAYSNNAWEALGCTCRCPAKSKKIESKKKKMKSKNMFSKIKYIKMADAFALKRTCSNEKSDTRNWSIFVFNFNSFINFSFALDQRENKINVGLNNLASTGDVKPYRNRKSASKKLIRKSNRTSKKGKSKKQRKS